MSKARLWYGPGRSFDAATKEVNNTAKSQGKMMRVAGTDARYRVPPGVVNGLLVGAVSDVVSWWYTSAGAGQPRPLRMAVRLTGKAGGTMSVNAVEAERMGTNCFRLTLVLHLTTLIPSRGALLCAIIIIPSVSIVLLTPHPSPSMTYNSVLVTLVRVPLVLIRLPRLVRVV